MDTNSTNGCVPALTSVAAPAIGVAAGLQLVGAVTGLAMPARRATESTNDKELSTDVSGRVAGVQNGA
jgi:hypothetical protein